MAGSVRGIRNCATVSREIFLKFERSEWTENFEECKAVASRYIKKYYYIIWDEAIGDSEPILNAIETEETLTGFIDRIAEKYDLSCIFDDDGLGPVAHFEHLKKNGLLEDG
ncbi:MAG: hypothetical protein OXC10_11725 [Rhodospirillaceae bacterium]|nr:hypothetical protein [Rhodospirillaceae bacterium]